MRPSPLPNPSPAILPDNALVMRACAHVNSMCADRQVTLLYLTLFGSTLYGTNMAASSDVDIRGIFLPSEQQLVLGKAPGALHHSTADKDSPNSEHDVDIDLWSVQHWLLELLPAGEPGAVDLLFSPTYPACILYRSPLLDRVFENPLRFIDKNALAYVGYGSSQAKKYGLDASCLETLRAVRSWLEKHVPPRSARLESFMGDLVLDCQAGHALAVLPNGAGLKVCGKVHLAGIRMEEFAARIDRELARCESALRDCPEQKKQTCKKLSHIVRALDQMEELLTSGQIRFPLKTRERILAIKQGCRSWKETVDFIQARFKEIDRLQKNISRKNEFDPRFAEECVLACYGLP